MTTTEDPRPGMQEQYARAINSSNLRPSPLRLGDVDRLIAAGMSGSPLGTMLMRLACEFDEVRGALRAAQARQYVAAKTAAKQGKEARQAVDDEARRQALQDRAFILLELKSLHATKQALGAWALEQASRRRFDGGQDNVFRLVGRVLDVWLDPLCHHCQGRGFNGGYDGPKVLCSACGGTGQRRQQLGRTDSEREFAAFLLQKMDSMVDDADRVMRSKMRG